MIPSPDHQPRVEGPVPRSRRFTCSGADGHKGTSRCELGLAPHLPLRALGWTRSGIFRTSPDSGARTVRVGASPTNDRGATHE